MFYRVVMCLLALATSACAALPQSTSGTHEAGLEVNNSYADRDLAQANTEITPSAPVEQQIAAPMTPIVEPISGCQRSFDMIMASAAEKLYLQHRM